VNTTTPETTTLSASANRETTSASAPVEQETNQEHTSLPHDAPHAWGSANGFDLSCNAIDDLSIINAILRNRTADTCEDDKTAHTSRIPVVCETHENLLTVQLPGSEDCRM
jgi:hypothetical protein